MGKRNGPSIYLDSGSQVQEQAMRETSRLKSILSAIFIAVAILMSSPLHAICTGPIHVDLFASGANNGQTWADAFTDLQEALDSARVCGAETIFVAAGTYTPDRGTNHQDSSFLLVDSVVVLGGFPNGGGVRNIAANPTELSGDIGMLNVFSDNTYHVIIGTDLSRAAILDGFIIKLGNAGAMNLDGGGLRLVSSDLTMRNCTVTGNAARFGGGIFCRDQSRPLIYNCEILDNQVSSKGGGLFNRVSFPIVINCLFKDNLTQTDGGAVGNSNADPIFINTVFSENISFINGGGMSNDTSAVELYNCTFNGNSCFAQGGALLNFDSSPTVVNCIFWGDNNGFGQEIEDFASSTVIRNSIVQGGYSTLSGTGINIFTFNPEFVFAPFNVRLAASSPAFNIGDPNFLVPDSLDVDEDGDTTEIIWDLDGVDRDRLCGVDLGAYEIEGNLAIYVDSSAIGGSNDGTTWTNAFLDLKDALAVAQWTDSILVAEGTYFPDNGSGSRDSTFQFGECTIFFGGWPSGGGTLSDRNYSIHPVVLSGNIGVNSLDTDNAYHVADASGVDSTCIVDGLTFKHGNANGTLGFNPNKGGGLIVDGGDPVFKHCSFVDNKSAINGGAIATLNEGTPTFVSCLIQGNTSASGGGVAADSASPHLLNCTIYGNLATTINKPGGVLGLFHANIELTNCLIWGNGLPIDNNTSSVTSASFSLIENGFPGTSNLALSPIFVNEPTDLHLRVCSPAVDAGDTTLMPPGLDLDGNPRVINLSADIGVYELQVTPVPAPLPTIGPDTSFCLPAGRELFPDSGNAYPNANLFWETPMSTDSTDTLLALVSGTYIVTLTDTNGCVGRDSVTLVALPEPTPELGNDTTLCTSNVLTLDPGSFAGYQWSTLDTTPSINISLAGLVTVTVTDANGCQSSDSMTISNFAEPMPVIIAPDSNIVCRNTFVALEVTQPFVAYQWSNSTTTPSTLVDTSGLFTVVVTDSLGCQGIDSFEVFYINVAGPSAVITNSGPIAFCNRDSVRLDAGQGFFSYRWFPDNQSTQSISVTQPGDFWVTVTNGFGCAGVSDTVTTSILPRPTPLLTISNDTLYANSANAYQWNQDGLPLNGETMSFLHMTPYGTGVFSVTITGDNGCDSTSTEYSFMVGIEEDYSLFGIQLFPNPTQGSLYISSLTGIAEPVSITVHNLLGQEMNRWELPYLFETQQFDIHALSQGIYTVTVTSGKRSHIRKIIKR